MKIREIMKHQSECVGPNDTLASAAQVMHRNDVPAVPVLDHQQPSGVVSDRMIESRKQSTERSPAQRRVRDVMTNQTHYLSDEDDLGVALTSLDQAAVDELPVQNSGGRIVGIITRADVIAALNTLN